MQIIVNSPAYKAAADSDSVWESFLPSNYKDIIDQYSPSLNSLPKKQIYLHLCDHPVLLANGHMTFSLEKASGKKCCMVGAEGLTVIWGDTTMHWVWKSIPESRFSQVADLIFVWWLEVKGSLGTKLLSPNTKYAVCFLFKVQYHQGNPNGFTNEYVDLSVKYKGSINESRKRVMVDPPGEGVQQREDGRKEVEMGEFFNEQGVDVFVDYRLWEINGYVKRCFIVEGVEFRPKGIE